MIKDVCDVVIMLEIMCGYDFKDSILVDFVVFNFEIMLIGDIKGKKIGILKEYCMDGMFEEIEKFWVDGIVMMKDVGVEIVDILLLYIKYVLLVYYVIVFVEVFLNFVCYDGVKYGYCVMFEVGDGIIEMYEKICVEGFGLEV